MDSRREFLRKASLLAAGSGFVNSLPASIQKAMSINPAPGSTYLDAEHIVFLMQENRSFDHTYGTLQGVRGFNDPRAITVPNQNPVWLQTNKKGDTYGPFRLNMKDTKATWMSSLPHSWSNQVDARNNGKYNKWLDVKGSHIEEYDGMPLTMGYYNREDIPFYYALADAFTVCDQNFCSSLTGTTPNRLYFWTGTIREKPDASAMARVWNEDADYNTMVNWKTFPERLEENDISWKVYQNEVSVGVGLSGEEDAWLANFGDNPLEYLSQYQVKLSAAYIDNIPGAIKSVTQEIAQSEEKLKTLKDESKETEKIKSQITNLKKYLDILELDQKNYTKEKYNALSQREKNIHDKAFSTNKKDPHYHQLTPLKYKEGNTEREVNIPKGDILHQFRDDVKNGQLPTVSWIVAPENFSDHPSSAWYGAWYISEVMDILTQNPEVWKKTIFILTYDENDGYFDHCPPFVVPHKPGTGKVSKGIDTSVEYVEMRQQSIPHQARESSIGLGFRVPMVVASPWSRGGWVCSEIFDHTSSLQFLEKFLSNKTSKKIEEPNISTWRRTICGDLSSCFRAWNDEKINLPKFLEREEFIESIYSAKFKKLPSGYRKLSDAEIKQIRSNPAASSLMPKQEKGIRNACAIPYELYADGRLTADKKSLLISFWAGNEIFGADAIGSPFTAYAPGKYKGEDVRVWDYTVAVGDTIMDEWPLDDFENRNYFLKVQGPNGFYREFQGNGEDPQLFVSLTYEKTSGRNKVATGNLIITIESKLQKSANIEIVDNAYKTPTRNITVASLARADAFSDLKKSYGWYDFTLRVKGENTFSRRFAGRVETGNPSKTDPFMGKVV